MQAVSFGMLLPCGTDLFTGVEYVCCPSSTADLGNLNTWAYYITTCGIIFYKLSSLIYYSFNISHLLSVYIKMSSFDCLMCSIIQ